MLVITRNYNKPVKSVECLHGVNYPHKRFAHCQVGNVHILRIL
jgi:hypothetical protein